MVINAKKYSKTQLQLPLGPTPNEVERRLDGP